LSSVLDLKFPIQKFEWLLLLLLLLLFAHSGAPSLSRKLNMTVTQAEAFINGFLGKVRNTPKTVSSF
jgi:hypothetical protein